MDIPVINQRIKFLIDNFFDGSENAFAKAIGVSQGTINRLFREDVRYNFIPEATNNTINKIINNLNGVNEDWLVNGLGNNPEKVSEKPKLSKLINVDLEKLKPVLEPHPRMTPFYDVDFYSGFDLIFNDQTIQPSYYFYHPDFEKAEFAVRNSGKSMSKILGPNDIIGMRAVNNWREYFPEGEVYGLVTSNDMRTIKHVKRKKESNDLILTPNPMDEFKHLYPEFEEIPKKMVSNFFQVVASMDVKKLAF